jgi:hypothetical protein
VTRNEDQAAILVHSIEARKEHAAIPLRLALSARLYVVLFEVCTSIEQLQWLAVSL